MDAQRTTAGIDIGKQTLHVCVPQPDTPPKKWPVVAIDLQSSTWYAHLLELVPSGSLVALEPTGWHYSRPVVLALEGQGCTIVYVNHAAVVCDAATAATRSDHISGQKTDPNDARALAVKAVEIAASGDLLGCKLHDPASEALTIALRLLLTKHGRAMTRRRSALNQIGTFGHGVWPALDFHKEAYARALSAGAASPQELRALAAQLDLDPRAVPAYRHAAARKALAQLAAELEPAPEPEAGILEALREAHADLLAANATIAAVEARIAALATGHELLSSLTALWLTVPGASPVRLAAIHAAAGCNAGAFNADQLRAACGCHPCRQESGQVTEAAESKRGYRPAKSTLHLWALYLLSPACPENPVRAYYQALAARGNRNALHAARGKLVRILAGIAKNGQPYHYQPRGEPEPAGEEPVRVEPQALALA